MFPSSFKVMLNFEIPGEMIDMGGKQMPMTISKEYTLSLSEKANLRRDLEGWRGRQFTAEELKGFAVEKVLGQPCIIAVIHKTSGKGTLYAAVTSISKLGKGMECPAQVHAAVHYEIEQGKSSPVFKALPEWVRKKIEGCDEWTHPPIANESDQTTEADTRADVEEDRVPF